MEQALSKPTELVAGKYRAERELSSDARSRTLVVRRAGQTRALVLKQFHFGNDAATRARFKDCSRALGGLKHPNIVRYADFGWVDDDPYIVSSYIEGETLDRRISDRMQLSFREFVPIAAQILKAYGYAHAHDFAVRNIGARAVMLSTRKGRANFVTVIDFGEADLIADATQPTIAPELMPPEVSDGAKATVTSDVYSIGCLFYRMLTGQHVFQGSPTELASAHRLQDPPPVTASKDVDVEVPDELAQLISECLAKDPAGRPADANAIVERLIDFIPMKMFKLPEAGAEMEPPPPTGVFEISALKTEPLVTQEMPVDPAIDSGPMSVVPAEPVSPQRSRAGLFIGLGLAAVAVGGLLAWQLGKKEDSVQEPSVAVADGGAVEMVAVELDSQPGQARVSIDGTDQGTTPLEVELAPGSHDVKFTLSGYQAHSETLVVKEGMKPFSAVLVEAAMEPKEVVVPGADAAKPVADTAAGKPGKSAKAGKGKPKADPPSQDGSKPPKAKGDDPFLPVNKKKKPPKKKKKPKPTNDDPFLPSSG